jgi:hypothetical protein
LDVAFGPPPFAAGAGAAGPVLVDPPLGPGPPACGFVPPDVGRLGVEAAPLAPGPFDPGLFCPAAAPASLSGAPLVPGGLARDPVLGGAGLAGAGEGAVTGAPGRGDCSAWAGRFGAAA